MIDKPHDNNFNLLRLIGASLVLFSHSYYVTGNDTVEPVNAITHSTMEASAIGLIIFFFISGYFVTKSANLSQTIFSFIKKRVLRIYPALIVCVLLSVFVAGVLLTELSKQEYFAQSGTYNYLLTATALIIKTELPGVFQNIQFQVHAFNASLWSISIEIQLYISLLLVLLLSKLLKQTKIFRILPVLLFFTGLILLFFYQNFDYAWKRNLNLMTVFYFGSFAYTMSFNKKKMGIIAAGSLLLYTLAFVFFNEKVYAPIFLWIAISAITYLIGTLDKVKINLKTDISYGLYIYAFPIQQIVFYLSGYNKSVLLNLIISFLTTALIALASWKFIEKPFIRIKNKE